MDNILLIFLNDLERVEEFNEIIDKFDKNGYKMYLLDNIRKDDHFSFEDLPNLVEFYKSEHENANKIVVLSNSRDLIFSWYRCYNSVVDDYIYFIDEDEKNYFLPSDRHFNFYYNLYEFNGIDKETVEGKIYLSKKDRAVLSICHGRKCLDYFSNFDFFNKNIKKHLNKKYIFNGFEYSFNSNNKRWESIKIGKFNKRIVFIKGQSQYDVLRIATDYKVEFYKELGFEVDILDFLGPNIVCNINETIINKKCDFIYAANCIGIDVELNDGRNLYDALDVPFLGTLGDHPVNQLSRIISSPQKTLFTCLDKENIEYFKKYFPNKKIALSNCSGYRSVNYKEKKFSDRKIDVLFAGSLKDPIGIKKSWSNLDKKLQLIMNDLLSLAIKEKNLINIDNEISKMFIKYNIKNSDLNFRAFIHSEVERYVRVYKRYELIKKIGESDLSVLCIGNVKEYNKLNKSGKLILKDRVNYETLLEMMNDSKMVLNITGHLYNGITERVLSAMINGAVAITEEDRFTKKHFKDGENIILYNFDTVVDKIKYCMDNIDKLEKVALNGQKEAISKYDFRISHCKLPRYVKLL